MSKDNNGHQVMPDRETFLANALLGALRTWKNDNDKGNDGKRPWIVTDEDLLQLETWISGLWEMHERCVDDLKASGITVIPGQPSKIDVPATHRRPS